VDVLFEPIGAVDSEIIFEINDFETDCTTKKGDPGKPLSGNDVLIQSAPNCRKGMPTPERRHDRRGGLLHRAVCRVARRLRAHRTPARLQCAGHVRGARLPLAPSHAL
jgi:hypothetical protein